MYGNDKQIDSFLQLEGEFQISPIDDAYNLNDPNIHSTDIEVLQLKENNIPRGMVPLEDLFDSDDVAKKPTMVPIEKGVEDVNIGAADNPKMIKLSKSLSPKTKI